MATSIGIPANAGDDNMFGDIGVDNLYGGTGSDNLYGGGGNDNLRGGDGSDQLYGGEGNDMLNGDAGADVMAGGLGDDTYVVDDAWDAVLEDGGEGYDTVRASVSYALSDNVEAVELTGSANLYAYGNNLDNAMRGNSGNNILESYDGKDSLSGGGGDDDLWGGGGHDWLQGGAGADDFHLEGIGSTEAQLLGGKLLNSTSSDSITDFQHGVDRIVVERLDFAGVNAGVLDESFFVAGVAANAAHAQFVYDAAKKALFYDEDGTGSGKAVKIADLNAGAVVTASDILVHEDAPEYKSLVLDFEDMASQTALSGYGEAVLPSDYHGFHFASSSYAIGVTDGDNYGDPTSGYKTLGTLNTFNWGADQGMDLHRTDGDDFMFLGLDAVSAWDTSQDVTFHGFRDGVEVYTETLHITRDAVTHLSVEWQIDDLQISVTADGGSPSQTTFDNLDLGIFPGG